MSPTCGDRMVGLAAQAASLVRLAGIGTCSDLEHAVAGPADNAGRKQGRVMWCARRSSCSESCGERGSPVKTEKPGCTHHSCRNAARTPDKKPGPQMPRTVNSRRFASQNARVRLGAIAVLDSNFLQKIRQPGVTGHWPQPSILRFRGRNRSNRRLLI